MRNEGKMMRMSTVLLAPCVQEMQYYHQPKNSARQQYAKYINIVMLCVSYTCSLPYTSDTSPVPAKRGKCRESGNPPEEATVRAELADGNCVSLLEIERLEALPGVLIPEVEVSIRSGRGEGAVLVERDRVH